MLAKSSFVAAFVTSTFALGACAKSPCEWRGYERELEGFGALVAGSASCGVSADKDHYDFSASDADKAAPCTSIAQGGCKTGLVITYHDVAESELQERLAATYRAAGFVVDPSMTTNDGTPVMRRGDVVSFASTKDSRDRRVLDVEFRKSASVATDGR